MCMKMDEVYMHGFEFPSKFETFKILIVLESGEKWCKQCNGSNRKMKNIAYPSTKKE